MEKNEGFARLVPRRSSELPPISLEESIPPENQRSVIDRPLVTDCNNISVKMIRSQGCG